MDGGTLRSRQLREILGNAGHEVLDLPGAEIPGSIYQSLRASLAARRTLGLRFLKALKLGGPRGLRSFVVACGRKWRMTIARIRSIPSASSLVWEDTWNPVVAHIAKESGHRLVAAPQNIEMLVPEQAEPFYSYGRDTPLQNELTALALSDATFTISREEQWLLRCFGIDAEFLPYYPPRDCLAELQEMRRERETVEKRHVLIMGSATNPPTRLGMIQVAHWLAQAGVSPESLVFAGNGTDALRDAFPESLRGRIEGRVSDERREQLFVGARAAIVHQISGTGALTRIGDMLMAGIPVLASPVAARSWYGADGLNVYNDAPELGELIRRDFPIPNQPERPVAAEKRFCEAVCG